MNFNLSNSTLEDYFDYYGQDDMCKFEFLDNTTVGSVLLVIFSLSVLGNGLLTYTLVRFEDLKHVSNLFFLCLASFDLLFTLTLPFWAVYFLHQWVFGETACKILSGAFHTGQYGRLLLLTAMTLDRFCTVVLKGWPLAQPGRRLLCARVACVATWVISIGASLRYAISRTVKFEDGTYYCLSGYFVELEGVLGYYMRTVFLFLVPLVVIVLCYSCILRTVLSVPHMRGRQRTVVLLFCIVAVFFVCFGPYNVLLYYIKFVDLSDCKTSNDIYLAYDISYILALSYSVINPVFCLGRPRVRRIVFQHVCCLKPTSHLGSPSSSNHNTVETHTA